MKEVSNRTLVVLLVLAVVFSFAGTLFSLTRLGGVIGIPEISGFGTVGEVNVTISQQIALNLTFPGIGFGSGYVTGDAADGYATLDSEKGASTGWSGTFTAGGIVIENIGNTDLNISFSFNDSATNFIGGTDPAVEWKGADNESGSCDSGIGSLVTTWTNVASANNNVSICQNLTAGGGSDSLDFYINLTIPDDAIGTKGVLINFEGSIPE